MNVNKLFARLKERGVDDAEYRYMLLSSFNCEVFRGELTNYSVNVSSSINIDAIIDQKLAMVTTEDLSNQNIESIIDQLFESAKYTNKLGAEIFKKKCKYQKFNKFNKTLDLIPIEQKIKTVFDIEKTLKALDSRIEEVEASYSEGTAIGVYRNTANINLKFDKDNHYTFGASIVIKDGEDRKTESLTFSANDFNKFNLNNFVHELYDNAIKKLNGISVNSQLYDIVFAPNVTDTLLECYVAELNAELILKNSSWFKDKLNQQVANSLVTILETPLNKNREFIGFDCQGVPTRNRILVNKGVLLEYLHNLETAKKFNVEPTGNASINGVKIGIHPNPVHLQPGTINKDEIIKLTDNGIYITDLEGFHAGFNAESGNFSLKAEGFIIKNGCLGPFINMMTLTANLFDIFKNIEAISENIEYVKTEVYAPCILVKKLSISC